MNWYKKPTTLFWLSTCVSCGKEVKASKGIFTILSHLKRLSHVVLVLPSILQWLNFPEKVLPPLRESFDQQVGNKFIIGLNFNVFIKSNVKSKNMQQKSCKCYQHHNGNSLIIWAQYNPRLFKQNDMMSPFYIILFITSTRWWSLCYSQGQTTRESTLIKTWTWLIF